MLSRLWPLLFIANSRLSFPPRSQLISALLMQTFLCFPLCRRQCSLLTPQANPVLQVVRQTGPQRFAANLFPSSYMKLSQPQLGLDPQVTKFRYRSTFTVFRFGRVARHLGPE